MEDIVKIFNSNYKVKNPSISSEDIRSVCSKYTIKKIVEYKIDINDINKQIQTVQDLLTNIDIEAYNKMKKLVE